MSPVSKLQHLRRTLVYFGRFFVCMDIERLLLKEGLMNIHSFQKYSQLNIPMGILCLLMSLSSLAEGIPQGKLNLQSPVKKSNFEFLWRLNSQFKNYSNEYERAQLIKVDLNFKSQWQINPASQIILEPGLSLQNGQWLTEDNSIKNNDLSLKTAYLNFNYKINELKLGLITTAPYDSIKVISKSQNLIGTQYKIGNHFISGVALFGRIPFTLNETENINNNKESQLSKVAARISPFENSTRARLTIEYFNFNSLNASHAIKNQNYGNSTTLLNGIESNLTYSYQGFLTQIESNLLQWNNYQLNSSYTWIKNNKAIQNSNTGHILGIDNFLWIGQSQFGLQSQFYRIESDAYLAQFLNSVNTNKIGYQNTFSYKNKQTPFRFTFSMGENQVLIKNNFQSAETGFLFGVETDYENI